MENVLNINRLETLDQLRQWIKASNGADLKIRIKLQDIYGHSEARTLDEIQKQLIEEEKTETENLIFAVCNTMGSSELLFLCRRITRHQLRAQYDIELKDVHEREKLLDARERRLIDAEQKNEKAIKEAQKEIDTLKRAENIREGIYQNQLDENRKQREAIQVLIDERDTLQKESDQRQERYTANLDALSTTIAQLQKQLPAINTTSPTA